MTCNGISEYQCTSCNPNYYFGSQIGSNECYQVCPLPAFSQDDTMTCVKSCREGQYGDLQDQYRRCKNCEQRCKICKHQLLCSQCMDGFYMYNHKCYDYCPVGTYKNDKMECSMCYSSCTSCNGLSENNCQSCKPDFYFFNNTCYAVCPARMVSDERYLNCLPSCLDYNQYVDDRTRQCKYCSSSCERCFGPTYYQCLSCYNSTYLHNDMCRTDCPKGTLAYDLNNTCMNCSTFQCI